MKISILICFTLCSSVSPVANYSTYTKSAWFVPKTISVGMILSNISDSTCFLMFSPKVLFKASNEVGKVRSWARNEFTSQTNFLAGPSASTSCATGCTSIRLTSAECCIAHRWLFRASSVACRNHLQTASSLWASWRDRALAGISGTWRE
jgi:hypothetical protein